MAQSSATAFEVYGYRFLVSGSSPRAVDGICRDFAFFRSEPAGGETRIEVAEEAPRYEGLPAGAASIYTPRNVVYRNGKRAYVDYHGKALGTHDLEHGGFRVQSLDPNLLYESCYLFLLSQISEYLDRRGMHRIHALGASLNGRAILVLAPMGGGKSTLGAHLLRHREVKLLSDDSPYVDARGRVHAFPLHLGLLAESVSQVPEERRRLIQRMEFGPKVLVDYDYFADRVCPAAEPGIVFLGSRTLSSGCSIESAGLAEALRAMVSNSVVGLGLFHGLEFILERSAWELLSKVNVAGSRLRNCLELLRRSVVRRLLLGRDSELNAETVVRFAREVLA
ncbi:MAG: hypothetical protein HY858_02870 [Candidatus Solibacter usitatus]|nr:hypothetical protein [Candidatus Solibacter usitatus]